MQFSAMQCIQQAIHLGIRMGRGQGDAQPCVPAGTVGGRMAATRMPCSLRAADRARAAALSPTCKGWMAVSDSMSFKPRSAAPWRNRAMRACNSSRRQPSVCKSVSDARLLPPGPGAWQSYIYKSAPTG